MFLVIGAWIKLGFRYQEIAKMQLRKGFLRIRSDTDLVGSQVL